MKKILLFRPYVSNLARFYAMKVLCGTQLAEGPVVKAFEREFGEQFMKKNVVSVNSGTTALELAYELAGVGPGDEVITPVLTCTATNLPLVRRGAKIVFADISDSLNMSIADAVHKITPRTKAIVFVHFGGNWDGLYNLHMALRQLDRTDIKVIEDAAQVVGAPHLQWGYSDFTCVSLQAIKTLTAGDGGFLICRDEEDANTARRLRWFGYDRAEKQRLGDTDLFEAGYKYHMNDISAAIGLGNLRHLNGALRPRITAAKAYHKAFIGSNIGGRLFTYPWLTILINPQARAIDKMLKANGIGSGPYHYRNDKYTIFQGERLSVVPNMDRLEESYTLLPMHHKVKPRHARRVIRLIDEFITNNAISKHTRPY